MKNFGRLKSIFLLIVIAFTFVNCTDEDDKLLENGNTVVQNFIWRGLNNYYLWQQDVPDLADGKYTTPLALNAFVTSKGSPENLFQELLYRPISKFPDLNGVPTATDRFSVLVDDYTVLENIFMGIRKTSGLSISVKFKSGTSGPLIGYVRYVVAGSNASTKNVSRGDFFYAINGTEMTEENLSSLLANDIFTLNFANYAGGSFTPNGINIEFTKTQITINPILVNNIITVGSKKVAYLMYNSFLANFNTELNNAFGQIKSQNVTDLVLDLRYNGGGDVQTATYLASMITGQFDGQVFGKEIWNPRIQASLNASNPDRLINYFTNNINGVAINNLNLAKVYILTTKSTASASELVINGLKPYVNVIQIGKTTIGKNAGSITLYDSSNFAKTGRSSSHKYAMQPLTFKVVDKNGFGDYEKGIIPNFELDEDIANLGILGNQNEPLLKKALDLIALSVRKSSQKPFKTYQDANVTLDRYETEMYKSVLSSDFAKTANLFKSTSK